MNINIDEIIDNATWREIQGPPGPTYCETYEGRAQVEGIGWVITAIAFDIEPQGFPAGSLGYDGAAAGGTGIVVRLTRAQAERAVKRAKPSG